MVAPTAQVVYVVVTPAREPDHMDPVLAAALTAIPHPSPSPSLVESASDVRGKRAPSLEPFQPRRRFVRLPPQHAGDRRFNHPPISMTRPLSQNAGERDRALQRIKGCSDTTCRWMPSEHRRRWRVDSFCVAPGPDILARGTNRSSEASDGSTVFCSGRGCEA